MSKVPIVGNNNVLRMRDDLEGIFNRIEQEGICSSCRCVTLLRTRYIGYKIDRQLCKSCFLRGMDRLFGIPETAEEVLYKGDRK